MNLMEYGNVDNNMAGANAAVKGRFFFKLLKKYIISYPL